MATQLEILRLVAPEFAAVADIDVQKFLDLAPLFIDPLRYPEESRGLALVYQAASLLYKQAQSSSGENTGGILIREKEGDLERAWAVGGNAKKSSGNAYDDLLAQLWLGIFGASIMTRYGTVVPQGVDVGNY